MSEAAAAALLALVLTHGGCQYTVSFPGDTAPPVVDTGCEDPTPWYLDADGDGLGDGDPLDACQPPPGYVRNDGDCDDDEPGARPGGDEIVYNGIDDDCDPATPDDDLDGDGYPRSEDCQDNDPGVNPGAEEVCGDGRDMRSSAGRSTPIRSSERGGVLFTGRSSCLRRVQLGHRRRGHRSWARRLGCWASRAAIIVRRLR